MAIVNSRLYSWSPMAGDRFITVSEDDVVANGSSAVVVANTAVAAGSRISFYMKTVGGTPGGAPYVSSITPSTGFSMKAAVGDTSTYHYRIET
jgi:hypothetical protein